jgi:hypothetical protein
MESKAEAKGACCKDDESEFVSYKSEAKELRVGTTWNTSGKIDGALIRQAASNLYSKMQGEIESFLERNQAPVNANEEQSLGQMVICDIQMHLFSFLCCLGGFQRV